MIEKALDLVARATGKQGFVDRTGRRRERGDYPFGAVREAVVNPVAHRDYTDGSDIELAVHADRWSLCRRNASRTRRPSNVCASASGRRAIACSGMSSPTMVTLMPPVLACPRRILGAMRLHNGTEVELIEGDTRFTVRLQKERRSSGRGPAGGAVSRAAA